MASLYLTGFKGMSRMCSLCTALSMSPKPKLGHMRTPLEQSHQVIMILKFIDEFSVCIKNSVQPQAETLVRADEQHSS